MRPHSGYRWQPPCQSAAAVVSHRVGVLGVASNECQSGQVVQPSLRVFSFLLFLAEQHSTAPGPGRRWAGLARDGPAGCCGLPDGCKMRSKRPLSFSWNHGWLSFRSESFHLDSPHPSPGASPDGGATSLLPPHNVTASLPGPLLNRTFLRQFSVVSGFWSPVSGLCDNAGRRQSWIFPARPGARAFPDFQIQTMGCNERG